MKKLTILLTVLFLIISLGDAHAQKVKLNIIGGYSLPLPDLKGTFPDDANSDKNPEPYFMKNGFNVGGIGKLFLDKNNSFGLTLTLLYNSFSNSVDNAVINGGVNYDNIKFKMNMFQVGIGGEYKVPVKGSVIPFFGLDLTANFLSGNTKVTPTNTKVETEYTLKSTSRFGFNIGAGTEFVASPQVSFVVGVKYQYFNLIGKDYVQDVTGTEYNLNDKEWTDALNKTHQARNMMGMQIYGGVNFNLDKMFK